MKRRWWDLSVSQLGGLWCFLWLLGSGASALVAGVPRTLRRIRVADEKRPVAMGALTPRIATTMLSVITGKLKSNETQMIEVNNLRDQNRALRLAMSALELEIVELRSSRSEAIAEVKALKSTLDKHDLAVAEAEANVQRISHDFSRAERLQRRALAEVNHLRKISRDALLRVTELEATAAFQRDGPLTQRRRPLEEQEVPVAVETTSEPTWIDEAELSHEDRLMLLDDTDDLTTAERAMRIHTERRRSREKKDAAAEKAPFSRVRTERGLSLQKRTAPRVLPPVVVKKQQQLVPSARSPTKGLRPVDTARRPDGDPTVKKHPSSSAQAMLPSDRPPVVLTPLKEKAPPKVAPPSKPSVVLVPRTTSPEAAIPTTNSTPEQEAAPAPPPSVVLVPRTTSPVAKEAVPTTNSTPEQAAPPPSVVLVPRTTSPEAAIPTTNSTPEQAAPPPPSVVLVPRTTSPTSKANSTIVPAPSKATLLPATNSSFYRTLVSEIVKKHATGAAAVAARVVAPAARLTTRDIFRVHATNATRSIKPIRLFLPHADDDASLVTKLRRGGSPLYQKAQLKAVQDKLDPPESFTTRHHHHHNNHNIHNTNTNNINQQKKQIQQNIQHREHSHEHSHHHQQQQQQHRAQKVVIPPTKPASLTDW